MKKKPVTQAEALPHPRTHNQFFGHKPQEKLVLESFYSGKMPHAWLISGPKNIGKATFAYRMAKFLCSYRQGEVHAETMQYDTTHPAIRRIMQGSSGDILVLEGEGGNGIGVEEVRKIAHFLHLTAADSLYRIVIIDSVDALNHNAANALLKLLEEPPANCFLLLVSHMPGTLLPTIRSRCRMLPMQIVPTNEAMEIVMSHADSMATHEAEKLLLLAEGLPGRALAFHHNETLKYYKELLAILDKLPARDIQAEYKLAELHANRGNITAWDNFTTLLNRVLTAIIKRSAAISGEELLPEEEALITRLFMQSTLDKWLELWEKVNLSIEEATRANLDLKQVTLVVFDHIFNHLAGK